MFKESLAICTEIAVTRHDVSTAFLIFALLNGRFMLPPTYTTSHYILAPYQAKDLERYLEMSLDSEVITFMGGASGSMAEERKMFEKIFEIYRSNMKRWFWIWGVYREEQLCAHLELKDSQHTTTYELEIVYMVHPAERRKGIMKEVINFLIKEQSVWKRQLIATLHPENKNSSRLLESAGVAKQELITDIETGEKYIKIWLAPQPVK